MASSEDFGSATITLDLDESHATRDAAAIGADIERALTRATRNVGRNVRENIERSLRTAVPVQVKPELGRFEAQLRRAVRGLAAVEVQVTANLDAFQRNIRRAAGAAAAVEIPVTANLDAFQRSIRRAASSATAVEVPVTADLSQFQRSIRRGGLPSIEVPVTPNVRGFADSLRTALRRVRTEIEVRANTRTLVREIETQLRRVRAPRIAVEVTADVSRLRSQLSSLDAPRIDATVVLDVDRIRAQLRELADQQITIPIALGEPGGGGGGAGDVAGGLLDTVRGAFSGVGELGLGAGTSALAGIRAGLLAAGPWGAVAAGVAAYAAVVGKVLMSGIEGVIERQKLDGALRASLGLGEAAADQVGRAVGQLYARGVVDSVEEGSAAVQASLRAGLAVPTDIPGLESISTKVADVASLLEEDVGKTARAVGQLVKTGLVDNASEGLDLLTKSVQQGGNVAEDLLDTFTEYPVQFKQLGLSAEDAFGLIQQGLRGGARDSDVIADSLKEFSIEAAQGGKRVTDAFKSAHLDAGRLTDAFAKGGPSARKALGEVFDKLQSIEDPLKRNQLAAGLFGTKAEDLASALGNLDLDTAAKEMDGFGGAATRAGDDLRDNLGTKLETISREAKQAFQGLFTGDFSQFKDLGTAIEDALPDLKDTGRQIAESIQTGIVEYGPKIFEAVFKIASDLGERVDIWGPLLLKLAAGAAALPTVIGALILTALAGALKGLGTALLPYLEEAWNAVRDFFTTTIPQFGVELGGQISDAFSSAFTTASGAVSSGVDTVVGFFTGLPGKISEGVSTLGTSIGDFFTSAFETAKQAVSDGITGVVDFFVKLPERIATGLLTLGTVLLDLFTTAIADLIIGVIVLIAGLVYVFTELPGKIYDGLVTLGTFLISAFQAGVDQVTTWLSTGTAAVIDFFANLPGQIVSGLSSLGSTLLSAFETAYDSVTTKTSTWATQALTFFQALPGRIVSALSSLASSVGSAFVSAFNTSRSKISDFITSAITFFKGLPGKAASALSALPGQISGAFTKAKGAASRAVSGLISDIVSKFKALPGAILAAVGNIGGQIISKVKSGLPSSIRKALPFADGGMVIGPTHALIGEAGPEVVIPLTRPARAAELAAKSGLLDIIGVTSALSRSGASTRAASSSTSRSSSSGSSDGGLGGAFGDIDGIVDEVGRNLVLGMIAGMEAEQGRLATAADDMAMVAVDTTRDTLGIASPSKVLAKVGEDTGKGLAVGLDKSSKAVKASAKKLAAGIATIAKDTGRGFIAGLTGTSAQIKSTTDKVAKDIIAAFSGSRSTVDDSLVRLVDAGNKKLQTLATQRDTITKQIADANKFAADTTASTLSAFSLSNLAQDKEANTDTVIDGLTSAVGKVKAFTTQVNSLAKKGLDKSLLQQIVGLGPEAGAEFAAALSSADTGTLKRINDLQKKLNTASTTLGKQSADALFDAGKQAGNGFLAGLKGQQKEIERAVIAIAKGLQNAIRTALRIKSPSKVMEWIGSMTGAGLHNGLMARFATILAATRDAARGVAGAVSGELSGLPDEVSKYLAHAGAEFTAPVLTIAGGKDDNVIPLYSRRGPSSGDEETGGSGRPLRDRRRAVGGSGMDASRTMTNHFTINEVGNGRVTADRVVNRMVLAAGGL